jgi:hypothetical protein
VKIELHAHRELVHHGHLFTLRIGRIQVMGQNIQSGIGKILLREFTSVELHHGDPDSHRE